MTLFNSSWGHATHTCTLADYVYVRCMSESSIQFMVGVCTNLTLFWTYMCIWAYEFEESCYVFWESFILQVSFKKIWKGKMILLHLFSEGNENQVYIIFWCTSSSSFIGIFAHTCWELSLPCKCYGLQIPHFYVLWAVVVFTKQGAVSIIGQYPSVSKFHQLQVLIFWFSLFTRFVSNHGIEALWRVPLSGNRTQVMHAKMDNGLNLVLERYWRKINNNDKRRLPSHLLAYLLTLIVKELKISVEQDRAVTTLNVIKHKILYLA